MSTNVLCCKVDAEQTTSSLHDARELLHRSEGEVLLDFSSVRRIDAEGLKMLQEFTDAAEKKSVKVVFRGVSVQIYKVLKLVNLVNRVTFVHES